MPHLDGVICKDGERGKSTDLNLTYLNPVEYICPGIKPVSCEPGTQHRICKSKIKFQRLSDVKTANESDG